MSTTKFISEKILLATLTQINSIAVISREFSNSFETIIKSVSSSSEMHPTESFPEKLQAAALYFLYKRKNFAVVVSEAATGRVWWPIVAKFNLNHRRNFKTHLNFT